MIRAVSDVTRRLEAMEPGQPQAAEALRPLVDDELRYLVGMTLEKDVDDVIGLVRANHLDVAQPQWRELFRKYGPPELHEKLLRLQRPNAT